MGYISRASLPEEFFDITSSMLLVQPEPQYFHALLWKMSMNAGLQTPGVVGLPMANRQVGGHGAPYATNAEERLSFDDPVFTDALVVVPELGKAPGQTVRVNRPRFQDTTYTLASRRITRTGAISTQPIDVGSEQVAVTIEQWAGPYDQVNSRVAPYGLDDFDASMSIHSLANLVGTHLQRDYDKWLDTTVVALLDAVQSTNVVYPFGYSSDNDPVLAGAMPLDFDTLSRANARLRTLNIPPFKNGKYVCIISPTDEQALMNDDQFTRFAQYAPPVNPLLNLNYVKSIGFCDIFRSNTLSAVNNTSSVPVRRSQMFGPGMVGGGVGGMPMVRASTDDNFGLTAKVIWEARMGFQTFDSRFGVSIRTA